MRRATTPTHTFTLPFEASEIKALVISYEQCEKIVLEKRKNDVVLSGNTVSLTLKQEETNLFKCHHEIGIQMRVQLQDGNVLASDMATITVERVLNDEVL